MLAATLPLASSAISATRSSGWIARQTSTALRAPGSSSASTVPNIAGLIGFIVQAD